MGSNISKTEKETHYKRNAYLLQQDDAKIIDPSILLLLVPQSDQYPSNHGILGSTGGGYRYLGTGGRRSRRILMSTGGRGYRRAPRVTCFSSRDAFFL